MSGRIAGMLAGIMWGAMLSPSAAQAQSLADVARQEAARREKVKTSGKVLTNADLPASAVVAPPAATPTSDGAAAPASAAPAADGVAPTAPAPRDGAAAADADKAGTQAAGAAADDEDGWRARAGRINKALQDARAQTRQLKALSDRLALDMQLKDPAAAARAARERDDVKAQLAKIEATEAEAFAARQALEHDARVAGVPPAWIQ